jgi:putative endonuclease
MSDWYLYMVRCRDGSLYTGISTDVDRRFQQHLGKDAAGSKYLRGKGPLSLVFRKKVGSQSLASKVEAKVKTLSKAEKEKLTRFPEDIEDLIKRACSECDQPPN